ncbi:MAG: ribbon-helix-helix protein, CopG family [Gammaproteobacteria bacterium]
MATITLRLPDSMDKALTRQSAASGLSKSDLAREALSRYLSVGEFHRLRRKLVPLAQARGIHTDEDVFRTLDES